MAAFHGYVHLMQAGVGLVIILSRNKGNPFWPPAEYQVWKLRVRGNGLLPNIGPGSIELRLYWAALESQDILLQLGPSYTDANPGKEKADIYLMTTPWEV